jgi:hypothetical protein
LNRRDALALIGPAASLVAFKRISVPIPAATASSELGALAEKLRVCERGEALDVAAAAIRGGADPGALLGAVFQAGILDVRPRHVGGKLHAVMIVESVFQLAELGDRRSAWLLALWNLDDLKRSQQIDREEGDWVLPRRPSASFASEPAARAEFLAAMEAWDDERADRALVGLIPFHDRASLFELLWPLAARSYVNIGHKIILTAQIERALGRIGWAAAEPALRSLVIGLLHRPSGTETDAFEYARALSATLPDRWLAGKDDAAQSLALLKTLRSCDSRGAQDAVAAAFKRGLGPATVWDALRLWASELFLRRLKSQPAEHAAALLPVHPVTTVNAFGHAWRSARADATRRLIVLQAAGWLPQLRDDLARIVGLGGETAPLEALSAGRYEPPGDLEELLRDPTPGATRAYLQRAGDTGAWRGRLAGQLARKAVEHHQHKYAAAVFEESGLVHPQWAPLLLACAVHYLPSARDPETELTQRSLRVLERAGV